MIITQENSKRVVQSHDFDSVNCTIDAEDMRYVASLLRNNYSKPVLAVIREIVANGLDANSEANATRKVEVTVPSTMTPHFVVRDFGGGLSQEDVFGLYSKYGKSTKRSSNNYIGAFGIGKFAPLSYGSNFTVVSYYGGVKTSYNVFVNEDDDTKIVKLHEEPSDEPTGLSVEVAVADSDINTFRDEVKKFFKFFSGDEMPKFVGVADDDEDFFEELKYAMVAEDNSWFILDDGSSNNSYYNRYNNSHYGSHAMMGRVHYPIDPDAINFDSLDDDEGRSLKDLVEQDNLYIRFDIGQLKLHHSRESLEYNKPTQKEIIEVLKKVRSEIEEIAKEKLGNAEDLWDAKVKYAQVVNNLPHTLRSVFQDSFQWNGIKIRNTAIERPYQYADSILITQCDKTEDADATDGFRVKSQKVTRILPQKNARLVIQDLVSSHGNALRVRTLFNEDDDCKVVYIVNATEDDAETHLYDVDGMGFVSISKSRIKRTSNIAKAKLQAKGRAVSGESRASVPLFELDTDGTNRYKSRNADYWLNCNEKIDDLEQGSRELVYVPIASYKVVNELGNSKESTTELGALLRDVQGIRSIQKDLHEGLPVDDDDFEFPLVVGVRRADCKKLNKPRWVSWDDYKTNFCKSYLVDNLDKVKKSEKAMAYKQFNDHTHLKHFKKIENLMQNKGFTGLLQTVGKMKDSHLVVDVANDLKVMQEDNTKLTTIFRMFNFLKENEPKWIESNIPSSWDIAEFDAKCEDICEKYPLLESVSYEVYGWLDMEAHGMGINLVKHIKMVDLMNEKNLVV